MNGVAHFCDQWPQRAAFTCNQNIVCGILKVKTCKSSRWFYITLCLQVLVMIFDVVIAYKPLRVINNGTVKLAKQDFYDCTTTCIALVALPAKYETSV